MHEMPQAHESRFLTPGDVDALVAIERVCSVFSLLGCVFIIVTFSVSKAFHKPINRLVFYASFGNTLTNVGTLMTRQFIRAPTSFGCQFQAFLIQMFMPADALWTLAMAINVYLTFYFKFDAQRLRKMELWYIALCYGVPFVPALAFIFVSEPGKGRLYGDATLWCWVGAPWDVLRVATFYGPVWVVIIITFFIYIRAGGDIYKKRKALQNFSNTTQDPDPFGGMDDPFSTKTTEIMVTTEDTRAQEIGMLGMEGRSMDSVVRSQGSPPSAYSVTISSEGNRRSHPEVPPSLPTTTTTTTTVAAPPPTRNGPGRVQRRRANYEANNAAWSYSKCAILFFTALLITWIPSSANRVYSLIHVGEISVPLEFMSALVLPLQGFWNCIVYIVTSWQGCRIFFSELFHRPAVATPARNAAGDEFDHYNERTATHNFGFARRTMYTPYETESMKELASESRPSSTGESKP